MATDWKKAEHWQVIGEGFDHLIAGEGANKRAYLVSGVSCSLPTRVHLYMGGDSQYGKSMFQRTIGSYFPKFKETNTASAKAHYYEAMDDPTCMANGIRMFDEIADQSVELRNQLKALTSQGVDGARLSTVNTDRKYVEVVVKGLPVVWLNSVDSVANAQLTNRFFKTDIDGSLAQDVRVDGFQIENQTVGQVPQQSDIEVVRAKDMISKIIGRGGHSVCNPLASQWRITGARNLRPIVGAMVSGVAVINRFARKKVGGRIVATASDNEIAYRMWKEWEYLNVTGIQKRYENFYKSIPLNTWMNKGELSKCSGLVDDTARKYATHLADEGYLEVFSQTFGENRYRRGADVPRTSVVSGGVPDDLAPLLKRWGGQIDEAQLNDLEFLDVVSACPYSLSLTLTGMPAQGVGHEICPGGSQTVCPGGSQMTIDDGNAKNAEKVRK